MAISAGIQCDCLRQERTDRCPHDGGIVLRRELGSDREVGSVLNLLGALPPVGSPPLPLLRRRVLSYRDVGVEDLPRLRAEIDSLRRWLDTHPEFDLPRTDSAARYLWVNEGRPALDRFLSVLQAMIREALSLRRPIRFAR